MVFHNLNWIELNDSDGAVCDDLCPLHRPLPTNQCVCVCVCWSAISFRVSEHNTQLRYTRTVNEIAERHNKNNNNNLYTHYIHSDADASIIIFIYFYLFSFSSLHQFAMSAKDTGTHIYLNIFIFISILPFYFVV